MNLEKLKEFFGQLFTQLDSPDSATVLFFLFGSFLIGTIFSWLLRGGKIKRLKKALKKKENEFTVLKAEHNALREQFDLKEADLKKAQLEAEDLKTKNHALEEEVSQVCGNFYAAQDEIETLKLDNQTTTTVVEDLNNQILGLKSRNTEIESVLVETEQSAQKATETQTSYDSAFGRLGDLEQKLSQLEIHNSKLQAELSSVKTTTSTPTVSTTDLAAIQTKLRALESENTRLNAELSTVKRTSSNTDFSAIQAKLDALMSDNSRLKSDVYSIKDTTRTKVVRMADEEMQEVKNRLAQLEQENKSLHDEVEQLKDGETEVEFVEITNDIEEIEVEELDEAQGDEKSNLGRQAIKNALGSKIKLASAADKDDLKKINGVGTFIEDKLNEIGIYTFEQISQLDDGLIESVTNAIQFFPGRIKRDDWVGQAKKLL